MQEVLSVSNDVAAELATVGDGVLDALLGSAGRADEVAVRPDRAELVAVDDDARLGAHWALSLTAALWNNACI